MCVHMVYLRLKFVAWSRYIKFTESITMVTNAFGQRPQEIESSLFLQVWRDMGKEIFVLVFVMKLKGFKQIVKYCGLWTPNMTFGEAKLVLVNFSDFKNDMCLLSKMIIDLGHIVLLSPKCHSGLVGLGI